MTDKSPQDAILFAAGRGERLWPYGDTNAKASLPIGNRALIQHQLDALAGVGVKRVIVATGHLEGMVRQAAAQWILENPHSLELSFVSIPSSRGTADSCWTGWRSRGTTEAPAILVPGDVFFSPADLKALCAVWDGEQVAALVSPVEKNRVQETVRIEIEAGTVGEIKAHSREYSPHSHSLSRLLIVPASFGAFLEATPEFPTCVEIGAMPPAEKEIAETLHQWHRAGKGILPCLARDPVLDIDGPWDFLAANVLSCRQKAGGLVENHLEEGASIDPSARIEGCVRLGRGSTIGPGVTLYGNLWVGDRSEITDGAYIEPEVLVGDDCKIWRGALVGKRTVVGHRCVVGHGAEVEGVMMDESYSYHYGEFWGVLGKCCDLGAATVCGTLRFDDGETTHRVKGKKTVPRHHANATFLGDYVRTGVNAILMPGVKVGCHSLVGAGVLLSGDIPNNTSVYLEQSLKRGSWGPEKYGW